MSDRPNGWDDMPEDGFLNSEEMSREDADKFIDELLSAKAQDESGGDGGEWYDLGLGKDPFGAGAPKGEEALPEIPDEPEPEPEKTPEAPPRAEPRRAPQEKPRRETRDERWERRSIRRSRKHRFGCLGGLLYFVFVVGISIILASLGWLWASDLMALGKDDLAAEVTLPESVFTEVEEDVTDEEGNVTGTETVMLADIGYVTDELKDAGLIKYKFLFKIFCSLSHADRKIDPGTYELNTAMDYRALVYSLQQGSGTQVIADVTVPEGYTVEQIFTLLEEKNVCTYDELMEQAEKGDFDYSFLPSDRAGAQRLEGYLFPDTYQFYENDDPKDVISKFLNNFSNKFTNEMEAEGQSKGRTMDEIVIIAAMIEKEAGADSERAMIASVIYNRLNNSDFPYLNIDATVQYALEERKEKLTYEDLEIDSPYNTYKYPGLPVGPISNPGLASIKAALEPESSDYYYYALNKAGTHEFFTNSSDFEAFVESDQYGG